MSENVNPEPRHKPPRQQTADRGGNASLFPPLWSIAATLLGVFIAVATLVMILILMGGNAAPARPPELIVLTAPALERATAAVADLNDANDMVTPEADSSPIQIQPPVATVEFVMQGPVLPTPYLSPTPLSIMLGVTIRVIDVGDNQLNVRERPGVIDVPVAFRAPENTLFTVIEGPSQADGLTWWRLQDVQSSQRVGWAASNYLEVVPTDVP